MTGIYIIITRNTGGYKLLNIREEMLGQNIFLWSAKADGVPANLITPKKDMNHNSIVYQAKQCNTLHHKLNNVPTCIHRVTQKLGERRKNPAWQQTLSQVNDVLEQIWLPDYLGNFLIFRFLPLFPLFSFSIVLHVRCPQSQIIS